MRTLSSQVLACHVCMVRFVTTRVSELSQAALRLNSEPHINAPPCIPHFSTALCRCRDCRLSHMDKMDLRTSSQSLLTDMQHRVHNAWEGVMCLQCCVFADSNCGACAKGLRGCLKLEPKRKQCFSIQNPRPSIATIRIEGNRRHLWLCTPAWLYPKVPLLLGFTGQRPYILKRPKQNLIVGPESNLNISLPNKRGNTYLS